MRFPSRETYEEVDFRLLGEFDLCYRCKSYAEFEVHDSDKLESCAHFYCSPSWVFPQSLKSQEIWWVEGFLVCVSPNNLLSYMSCHFMAALNVLIWWSKNQEPLLSALVLKCGIASSRYLGSLLRRGQAGDWDSYLQWCPVSAAATL